MAVRAGRVGTMLLHAHAYRAVIVCRQWPDIRRWIGRSEAEEYHQNHSSAHSGRRAVAKRTDGQETSLSEDSGAIVIGESESPKIIAG